MLTEKLLMQQIMNAGNTTYLTHNFHPYAAKFIPQIPRIMIEEFTDRNDVVLDPFCGCGTTLVEAKMAGRNSIGVDLHPIATLASRVKATKINESDILTIENVLLKTKSAIKKMYASDNFCVKSSFHNRDHWFQPNVLMEIETIKKIVESVKSENIRNFLKIGLSSIIVSVSNQESETRYAALRKSIPNIKSYDMFERKITDMINRIREFNLTASDNNVTIFNADSRNLSFLPDDSIDFIVTSPPYANTYDYYLYHKLRMYLLGYDVKDVQDNEIGSRNRHSSKREGIETYQNDMLSCFKEFSRVTKRGAFFVIVIGDSIIRKDFIDSLELTKKLATMTSFEFVQDFSYSLNLTSRTFNSSFRNKTKNEHIIVLKNVK